MKTIKVLQVLDHINSNSGVSSVVMNYYTHMESENIKFDFLLFEEPDEEWSKKLKASGADIYVTGQPSGSRIGTYIKNVDEFFRVHGAEYQIVHVHIPNCAFAILKSAKKYSVPVRILHSHNSRGADGLIKKVRNFVLNKQGVSYANHYFACSKSAGQYLYGKKHLNDVTIIPNAIDLKKFQYSQDNRAKIREALGIREELVLGHVGRFSTQKNHEFLIEIVNRLKEKEVAFKLVLLGSGELQEQIKEQIEVLGLEEHVVFVGVVNNAKEYMDAMDLFVLPSLYEGLPCVCIEAQANGLPCLISSNVTKEVELSDFVKFLEITDAGVWAETILEQSDIQQLEQQRKGYSCEGLKDYDIIIQAKILEERYLSYGNGSDIDVDL